MASEDDELIRLRRGRDQVSMLRNMANRHVLVAGATGTGKTVTFGTARAFRMSFRYTRDR